MRLLVVGCGALLALALVGVLLAGGLYPDVLVKLGSQARLQQLALLLTVVVALAMLGVAFWSNEKLVKQQRAMQVLESRLRVEEAQRDVDRATSQLGRTVSDAALHELTERLSRAEKELAAQQQRSEVEEFRAHVQEISARQQTLKEKLGEVIAVRKSVERLFLDYESTQGDIERTLSGIEVDQKGDALDARIGNLSQFAKITGSRMQELEQHKQMLLGLGTDFEALQGRLAPLKDERGGIKGMIHQLNDMSAQLVANMEALEREGGVTLAERIKRISENRHELSERLSKLADELSKLDDSHKDLDLLFARLTRELTTRYRAGLELGTSVAQRTAAE